MRLTAYQNVDIKCHVYEHLYLIIYDHSEKPVAALISVPGECRAECANNVIIASSQMK